MITNRYITLVIHTYDRAVQLRKILESHGIEVKFENLVISGAKIASGVRVKIHEKNLPLALKITESGEAYSAAKIELQMAGAKGNVLIPIDFSQHSLLACRVGFEIAEKLSLTPVLLHAYATPYFSGNLAYESMPDGIDPVVDGEPVAAEMEVGKKLRSDSERQLVKFKAALKKMADAGELPELEYNSILSEGVPEEVILDYCRLTPPAVVVMATRGKNRKEEDLIGSVTAEVLDSCRLPILAVPENFQFKSLASLSNLVYFCNLDQHDILSVDTLMRLFSYPDIDVTLIPVNDRAGSKIKSKTEDLCGYFTDNYPTAKFKTEILDPKNFRKEFEEYVAKEKIDMLIVPNKKKNIFSRLFNPGIAHKLLFERDMPLLAMPV